MDVAAWRLLLKAKFRKPPLKKCTRKHFHSISGTFPEHFQIVSGRFHIAPSDK